jgi:ABC-2 type transport system permease protein
MRTWLAGTRLVAERGLIETIRSRTFKVVTAVLLLLSVAAVTLPQIIGNDGTTYTLVTQGPAPVDVAAALDTAANAGGFKVEYVERESEAAVRQAVRDGDATTGLAGNTLFTATDAGGTFPVLVAQAVVTLETTRRLVAAGLTPQQVTELQSIQPPEQVTVGRVADEGRAGVGFLVGIILYIALTFAGTSIATIVATEKSTRISEVLLAVLRPTQILVGTVVAVGIVSLGQLLVLATPLAIAVRVTDSIGLPPVATGDLALAVAWFVLGFALYAFLFAATAALVDKVTEVNTAIMPVTLVLLAGYLLAVTVVAADPNGPASIAASIFPLSAPLAMPIRWAAGDVPILQLVLAMTLTALTAVLMVGVASSIYQRALLITGRRVRLREVVGVRAGAASPRQSP